VIYTNICSFLIESHTIRVLVIRVSLNTCQITHTVTYMDVSTSSYSS